MPHPDADVVNMPPSVGQQVDPQTGVPRPQAFLRNKINGQYVVEGLAASFLYIVGALGLILLDQVDGKGLRRRTAKYLMIFGGITCIVVAYSVVNIFFRFKVPRYLAPHS